jgi:hypothetical protein
MKNFYILPSHCSMKQYDLYYMTADLNVKFMYCLYREKCHENYLKP